MDPKGDWMLNASDDIAKERERLAAATPRKVRVGGIVVAQLGPLTVDRVECKVVSITNAGTGEEELAAELSTVRLFCRVEVRPSGRKLTGPEDYSTGPWEEGCTTTVLLPGYDILRVVS
jgi:hypothetical protein